jgi:hypothetical protein
MAIPFLLIEGYHTLLDSRSGTLVDEPARSDPGWTAVVAATPVIGLAEVVDGTVSGVTLVVQTSREGAGGNGGGTVVLVPGDTSVPTPDGLTKLSTLPPSAAVRTLAQSMRITLSAAEVMDSDAWIQTLAGQAYEVENPDPVPTSGDDRTDAAGAEASLAFAVGNAVVGGSNAAIFLGRPVDGASPSSLMPRRQAFWEAFLADPPSGTHRLATTLGEWFAGGGGRVTELPTEPTAGGPLLDSSAAEELVRTIIAFPSGERLKVRVVDRTGAADLESVAASMAGRGVEVVEIANAVQFDDGATELIVPAELTVGDEQLAELVAALGVEPIVDDELGSAEATLLVGVDFEGLDP